MQPPPRALIAPLEQGGAERSWGQCGRTLGQPSRQRLALVGCWLGQDGSHAGVLAKVWSFGWACLLFCLNAPSRLRILVYFHVLSYKTYIPKLVENVSCKP